MRGVEKIVIEEKAIVWTTNYGKIDCKLKKIMDKKHLSMYKLIRLSGLKYEVVSKYYYNNVTRYDADVLAKICYILDCNPSDLITYSKEQN